MPSYPRTPHSPILIPQHDPPTPAACPASLRNAGGIWFALEILSVHISNLVTGFLTCACGIFHTTQTNLFLFMLDTLAVKANKRAVVWVCTRGWYGELKLLRD
jgi:hypothetical protein